MHAPKTMLAALALGLTTLAISATATAQDRLQLSLGGSEAAVTDTSFDYLSEDPFLSLGQLGAEASLAPGVWVGLEYQWGVEERQTLQRLDTSLDVDGLFLTGRYQYDDALSFLSPYAGLAAGFYHLEMRANLAGDQREQARYAGAFHGALGVDLHTPKGFLARIFGSSRRGWASDLTVGFNLEVGYRLALSTDFDDLVRPEPDKEPEPEDVPLDASAFNLGGVDLSGLMMRSALTLRF